MEGRCPACERSFTAELIHNGFNDSSYAYCAKCGRVALCSHWTWPASLPTADYAVLPAEVIPFLQPCPCGGLFHTHAMPRCPHCRTALNPMTATPWIEAASAPGWHWQQSWLGLYALVIQGEALRDPWLSPQV